MKSLDDADLDALIRSDSFFEKYRSQIGKRVLYEAQLHDPILVEYQCAPEHLEALLRHIDTVWTRLGEEDAHWSVVSAPEYRADRIRDTIQQFHRSGKTEVENLKRLLARVGADVSGAQTALEYGCGVGRVTRWLGAMFPHVIGVDISANHLRLARQYFSEESVHNVTTTEVKSVSDIDGLPDFDFLYSKIVLQHNPPPVIHRTLDTLCGKLRPGGTAVVQVPTYCRNYSFHAKSYLAAMDQIERMEMHVLPQRAFFELMEKHHCHPLEVFRDHLITSVDFVSSTFVFVKR